MTLSELMALRIRPSVLPLTIVVLTLGLGVMLPVLSPIAIHVLADALFVTLVFQGLIAKHLPALYAFAVTVLTFAQSGVFLSAANRAGSIWLALAVYCVAAAAAGFVHRRDARAVILLGGALSIAQILDPVGRVLAVFLLPVCVGLPRPGEAKDKAGLLALLLFMPVITAVALAYARLEGISPAFALRQYMETGVGQSLSLYWLLFAGFAGAPILWLTALVSSLRRPVGLIAVYTAVVAMVAVALASLLGNRSDMARVLATVSSASAVAMCNWPRLPRQSHLALAASALAAVLSWLLIHLPDLT